MRPPPGGALALLVTEANVRLVLGSLASLVLLGLIVHDAITPGYSLEPATIYLLTGFIWAFLGIDVLAQVRKNGQDDDD